MRARRARDTLPLAAAALLAALVAPGCHGSQTSAQPAPRPTVVPSPRRAVVGSPDPRELDLDDLVPRGGRIDHVWYVPAGSTVPEVAVAWSYRGSHATSAPSDEPYALTVWRPVRLSPGEARWRSHALFRGSPFPLGARSVRAADVTGDGHPDLLVTVECNHCNHGATMAAVFADARTAVRRIYGDGFLDGSKGEHVGVHGRPIVETAWGAWHGLLWFDEPRGGGAVCCPDYRLQTFLRWRQGRWRKVRTRRLDPARDRFLGQRPVPAP